MTRMNPEIKARWVAALRSGEYKQGKGYLNRQGQFCCLGVLCDLHSVETGTPWESNHDGVRYYDGISGTLPPMVEQWAGLNGSDSYNPSVVIDLAAHSVATHNDEGRTFAEIADAIEEQL